MKVELILRSFEKDNDNNDYFEPEKLNEDMKIIAGKAAGICYMPDNYLDEGIQNKEAAIKRSCLNAKSGHYSVYEHGHVTFMIECSKAMAMVLNSTRLYSTSEKSARYTKMKPKTELEVELYNKWKNIFSDIIRAYYKDILTDKEVEKLAMENARYLTSVFTPTTMEFTVPFSRAILLCGWLDELANIIDLSDVAESYNSYVKSELFYNNYYKELAKEASEMANEMRKCIGICKDNPLLKDHKDIGINFFSLFSYIRTALKLKLFNNNYIDYIEFEKYDKKEYYGDVYCSKYKASFASIAQLQRHRTLNVSIYDMINQTIECYIPNMIKNTRYEEEWVNDFDKLLEEGVCPQATLMNVIETGSFEDFVLKCKERLCARAQLETAEIVRDQVYNFCKYNNNDNYHENLSYMNYVILLNMRKMTCDSAKDIKVKTRCKFTGYICNEPCKFDKSNYNRII